MKMNLWKTFGSRWEKEELQKWSSFKKTAYLLLPLLVYFAVHDMAEVLFYFLLQLVFQAGGKPVLFFFSQYEYTIHGIVYGAASLIGAAAILPVIRGETGALAAGWSPAEGKERIDDKRVTAYILLAAVAFCMATGINIFFYLAGFTGSSKTYSQVHEMQYGVQFAVGLVLFGIISPLVEEAVFRGVLYNRMKRCFHYQAALIVSSLLFGLYHGNMVQAVYGSMLGLMIAYFYEQYKSFAAPVLFHGVANVSVYTMTYQNQFAEMDRKEALPAGAIFIAVAVAIFHYIKKKYLNETAEN